MILAFDTSGPQVAAALWDGSRAITRIEPMAKGQAERLLPLIEELLAEAGASWPDITRIAVGTGPGNFTGTRIAVAAARGLALGLDVPAVGVSSLDALSDGTDGSFTLPAPRGRRYVQAFQAGEPLAAPELEIGEAETPNLAILLPAMARIAAGRDAGDRPKPLYVRPADAAPPSDPPPVILPG